MSTVYKKVKSIEEFIDAIRIRADVFIVEQKCQPGWEPDEQDKKASHFIAIKDDVIISTLRVRETAPLEVKIERMATKKEYRNMGISKQLVKYVLKVLAKLKVRRVWIESQVQAKGFYEKLGFETISEPYDQWNQGIPHIKMELLNDKN